MTGRNIAKGMVAGLIATLVLSVLMVMKSKMNLMPEFDIVAMLTGMMAAPSPIAGWLAHFAIGVILWGGLFAWLDPELPTNSHVLKGIFFGIGAWILMMTVLMPIAGAGFFALNFGMMAPLMTFLLHIIFGAVLGGAYGLERPEPEAELQFSRRSR